MSLEAKAGGTDARQALEHTVELRLAAEAGIEGGARERGGGAGLAEPHESLEALLVAKATDRGTDLRLEEAAEMGRTHVHPGRQLLNCGGRSVVTQKPSGVLDGRVHAAHRLATRGRFVSIPRVQQCERK